MRKAAVLGLLAMLPASLNAAVPSTVMVIVPGCQGSMRAMTVPLAPDAPAQGEGKSCCVKGCHAGSSRKRLLRHC